MTNLVPLLSTVLPIIASSLIIVVIIINFYFKIRRKFPISVNCWFCNTWTKVHYDDRDSFDCPTCLQYNGFTKDGDYNKIIPEQHDELMNKSTRIKHHKTAASNGLCALCNNNQQLKIFQLANFVPLNEENYDVEIEHFQEQLEKAYKLCRKCDKVLKKTIDNQNAWIFGNKIKNMYSNGVASLQKISNNLKKGTQLSILSRLNGCLSVLLVLSIILIAMSSIKYFTKYAARYVPTAYVPVFKTLISMANTPHIINMGVSIPHIPQNIKIEPFVLVCCFGLVFQIIGGIWEKYSPSVKLNRSLCWIILLLSAWIRLNRSYATYVLLIEGLCCVYLLLTSFNKEEIGGSTRKNSGKSMRKIVKNLDYTCTDFSDSSDFEDVSGSSKKTNSSQNSFLSSSTQLQSRVPVPNTASNVVNMTYTDLNRSLNNLHLGFKSPSQTFSVASVPLKRPKPVLSPPRLQTMNSWVAGGFWPNVEGVMMPVAQRTNLSRSSSESSGFGSQHNENFQFVPARNHFLGEFDKLAMNSELCKSPNYLFSPICKPVNNAFYPNLQQNNLLMDRSFGKSPVFSLNEPYQRKGLFQNWSDKINAQATQSFQDLRLQSNHN